MKKLQLRGQLSQLLLLLSLPQVVLERRIYLIEVFSSFTFSQGAAQAPVLHLTDLIEFLLFPASSLALGVSSSLLNVVLVYGLARKVRVWREPVALLLLREWLVFLCLHRGRLLVTNVRLLHI